MAGKALKVGEQRSTIIRYLSSNVHRHNVGAYWELVGPDGVGDVRAAPPGLDLAFFLVVSRP